MEELRISGRVNDDVVYDGNLRIAQGTIVNGSVFATGTITTENRVHIYGNVVAKNEVVLGNHNDIRGLVESQLSSVEFGDENFADSVSGFEVIMRNLNNIRHWISSPGGVKEIGTLPNVWGVLFD